MKRSPRFRSLRERRRGSAFRFFSVSTCCTGTRQSSLFLLLKPERSTSFYGSRPPARPRLRRRATEVMRIPTKAPVFNGPRSALGLDRRRSGRRPARRGEILRSEGPRLPRGNLAAQASVAATAKHFCAGGAAVMPAFNAVAGVPMTAHIGLLRGFLKRELGFEGVVISDYAAIAELIQLASQPILLKRPRSRSRRAAIWRDADVLTGCFNPTGRLPVTWPRDIGQIPIFYAERSSGRPADSTDPFTSKYLDLPTAPLFPFGHGLSFGRVKLEKIRASPENFQSEYQIKVEVDAVNEGRTATEETIILFVHDCEATVARPLMELKAWEKIALAPGQTKTVAFALKAESFCFPGQDLEPMLEPGDFDILVGLNADRKSLLTTSARLPSWRALPAAG